MGAGDGVMLEAGTATQEIDGTRVTLTMAPWPPETLTETTLTVAVQQGEQAVTGLQPALDLTMPGIHGGGMGWGMMGNGWRHANGSYGMVFTFTTA